MITKKDHKAKLKTRSCHDFILLNQDTTNRIELRKTVNIEVVMVIQYGGTSPKLGSCQGECPYPDTQFCFGDEEEGGGGVVEETLSFKIKRFSNLHMTLRRKMMCS